MAASIALNQGLKDFSSEASGLYPHRLMTRVDFEVEEFNRICAIYVLFSVDVTLITDIFRFDTYANGNVDITTDASNMIAGLSFATATGLITAGTSTGWLQYWGPKATLPGSVALSNNLLGDGSVAAGEAIMPHASTDGMVDTYAGTTVTDIGVSLEADAPAIAVYCLMCKAAL